MIRLENVTTEYDLPPGQPGQLVAADRLTMEVPAGEVFGLVGPNGAGKTTTLKMICGLMLPTAGRITVNDIDVEQQPEEVQRYIGYLADFFSVYDDLKTWEYVEHFARAYKLDPSKIPARVREVIAVLGLETKYDAFVGSLSRGMKQRLGVARAIVHDPPLLVLDEPASGLDPKARLELKDLIRRLNREGKTVFITSHVLSDLE
jgi:ABC-2 type transport system ATP-binding protein